MYKKKALILGASGLVGGHLLTLLLRDEMYQSVISLGRKSIRAQHPKLFQLNVDFEKLDEQVENFKVDQVFCCLGTTLQKAKSRKAFARCDRDYVVKAAKLSAAQNVSHFLVVSALGASEHSAFFYNRTKGEMEKLVYEEGPSKITFIRPSLLLGQRDCDDHRPVEAMAQKLLGKISRAFVGPLKAYRPVKAQSVAALIHQLAKGEKEQGAIEHLTLIKNYIV